ncbi:hypothetical protein PYCCODRAFT_1445437 [Trametes coccinea BRFM310]|uniref:Polynucleotide 5'-hydroxyl-kinase GRC3 n=1 Tax=Trametes coccinea (strain BRFM310) TaxID=1353009 RepID=A0A1Y2IKM6_TRAC3|nr:hypothetical protein PYCCODRAFT_1445437 [Trametes coccinea BRFM310]
MLSAVAARKARLAQAQGQAAPQETKPTSPPAPSSEPAPRKKSTPAKPAFSSQKPPSKRKPSAPTNNPPKRRKTKNQDRKGAQEQPGRYFAQQDAFRAQDDVIVVDDSDDESSVATSSAASDDELPSARASASLSKARGNRAWSPSAPLADSSDEDDDEADEHVSLDHPHPQAASSAEAPRVLSTFEPTLDQNVFRLSSLDPSSQPKRAVLLLRAPETVALLGVYSLTVLRGAVTLAGVTLKASSTAHPVFAPRSSSLPIIQCLRSTAPREPPLPSDLPANVHGAASGSDAVILLQELHTGIEGLGRVCRTFDGFFAPSRWHRNQLRFDLGLGGVYFLPFHTPDITPLVIPSRWTAAADAAVSNNDEEAAIKRHVYLVRGPKNAGKSTFARFLLNRLLSRYRRVAYLECDLGQSEFAPGGLVSLNVVEQPVFGPPFSHPSIPFSAHYIGAASPRSSPSHYLDSIQALIQQYELDVQNAPLDEDQAEDEQGRIVSSIPLVVNTMGWTKGLGADLARKVEDIVSPSDVFALMGTSAEDEQPYAVPTAMNSGPGGPRVHTIESVPPSPSASHYTAADHRNIAILSYFHAVFPHQPPSSPYASPVAVSWNTALPLCAQPPYEVDWKVAFDKLVLTGAGMEDIVPEEVPTALNCAVVGLVSCEPGTLDSEVPADDVPPRLPYEQGASPPLPSASRCLGLALVRAISPSPKTSLQLLTPVPSALLHSARVLVMGELQLPVWGMLDYRTLDGGGEIAGYERGKVPYLRWGKGEGAGGERRRVRRNLMRKGQM